MRKLREILFNQSLGNSIEDVKKRLIFIFSVLALSTSFFVFFSFSLYLIFNENTQLELYLRSFEQIAKDHYSLVKGDTASLGPYIQAYYSDVDLDSEITELLPLVNNSVTQLRMYDDDGFLVFYSSFLDNQGNTVPLYLVVGNRAIDFGDDGWEVLMLSSFGLMCFLILFLRFALRRVFDGLMSPVSELSEQLSNNSQDDFKVTRHSIDEIQQLTSHLNDYKQMKERLAKQEMMFAKYASHELKTPIAVVLGAANLQAMKDDPDFQAKQRERILVAANNMQATVEVLLSIVKQENVRNATDLHLVQESDLQLGKYSNKMEAGVVFSSEIEPNCQLNMPPVVLNMILKNLLNNAIRFTQQGEISLMIDSHCIQVIDSGSGLTDKLETEHGLGLLIVKRLCDSYGWTFELSNNVTRGCCAKLTF